MPLLTGPMHGRMPPCSTRPLQTHHSLNCMVNRGPKGSSVRPASLPHPGDHPQRRATSVPTRRIRTTAAGPALSRARPPRSRQPSEPRTARVSGASRHVCTSTVVCGSPRVVHVVAAEGAACRKWRRCRESTRQRGARPTSTWWVYVHVVPWCTGESSCVHTTGVLLGGSGSHAHCPHVCDLQATLTTLSTRTATPAAAQQNTRPILSTGPLQPLVGATLIVRRCSA
jgi:hypothetical protein